MLKHTIHISIFLCFLIGALLFPITGSAQSCIPPKNPQSGFNGQLTQCTNLQDPWVAYGAIGKAISVLLNLTILSGALVAFVFFVRGAIQWGTARAGDGAAKGRTTMLYAAIGLILLACVYVFILFYNNILPKMSSGSCDTATGQVQGCR